VIPGFAADGFRLALTTFTIAPLRPGRVDRATAGVAMSVAPYVGLALGAIAAAAALGFRVLDAPPFLAAVLAVALALGLTRGLHLDGLADTIDGLGSYRDAAGTLDVMRKPDVGPFGVAAICLVLLGQVAALASVLRHDWPAVLAGVAAAFGTGRLAVAFACRRGVPAARESGLGALVAGTVRWPALAVGVAAVAGVAVAAVPDRPWRGPAVVVLALAAALLFTRHLVRRIGGITGDVLGAQVELAGTAVLVGVALSPA
jgi:adenosylcobinamide-GDP ribazoletransferase